jgi:DNA-binding response OmpR family regulator
LGSARAGFVASVRRKAVDLAEQLKREKRKDLRLRLSALRTGARSMHLEALELAVSDMMGRLDRGPEDTLLTEAEVGELERSLEHLPELAWERNDRAEPAQRLVVAYGREFLPPGLLGQATEVVFCSDMRELESCAAEVCADAILLDADLPDATEVAEALLDLAPFAESPVVAVGAFDAPEQEAMFQALGVRATLKKPVDAGMLIKLLDELRDSAQRVVMKPMGAMTLEELSLELATEVRRGLRPAGRHAQSMRLDLGDGVDVQAALWGALARIREILSARTRGDIQFQDPGPFGAIALAPSTDLDLPETRRAPASRGGASEVSLKGRRVLVVDDDPAITWFIADLLRGQGALVDEALNGEAALLQAFASPPELIISDILMPKLDGPSLCRMLERDVVLQHTPMILLSWKEDLIQRMREVGSSATAFLRKESDSKAVVARIQEALRARARLEARVKQGGPVRGRLDGWTVSRLVEMVSRVRPDCRIALRDAAFLYELEVRDGALVCAVRTGDDQVLTGVPALRGVLGVTSGRFTIEDSTADVVREFDAPFRDLVAPMIAERRAVVRALVAEKLLDAASLDIDPITMRDCLRGAAPHVARIGELLIDGLSPREVILRKLAEPSELDAVLLYLARRGAILSVANGEGQELSVTIALPRRRENDEVRVQRVAIEALASQEIEPSQPLMLTKRLVLPALDVTDVSDTVIDEAPGRVATNVDHTLYGGRLLDVPSPAPSPSAMNELRVPTPSPSLIDGVDVISAPLSMRDVVEPTVPVDVPRLRGEEAARSGTTPSPVATASTVSSVEATHSTEVDAPVAPAAPDDVAATTAAKSAKSSTAAKSAKSAKLTTAAKPGTPAKRSWAGVYVFGATIVIGLAATQLLPKGDAGNVATTATPSDEPIPADMPVAAGEGAVAIETGPGVKVMVDGVERRDIVAGRLALAAGTHTFSTGVATRTVDVKPLRLVRVRLPSAP